MANETTMTIVGNLTDVPELRFLPSGVALAKFTVASTPRVLDKASGQWRDGDPLFMACTAWRDLAEHVTESLIKGTRVVVVGRLKLSRWETEDGQKRSAYSLDVDEVGPSLRYATASVKKLERSTGTGFNDSGALGPDDPWASASTTRPDPAGPADFTEEPPF